MNSRKPNKEQLKHLGRVVLRTLVASIIISLIGARSPIGRANYNKLALLSWDYLLEVLKTFLFLLPVVLGVYFLVILIRNKEEKEGTKESEDSLAKSCETEDKRKPIIIKILKVILSILVALSLVFLLMKPWATPAGKYVYKTYNDWHIQKIDKQEIISVEVYHSSFGTRTFFGDEDEGEAIKKIVEAFKNLTIVSEADESNLKGPVCKLTLEFELGHVVTITFAGNYIKYADSPFNDCVYEINGAYELENMITELFDEH